MCKEQYRAAAAGVEVGRHRVARCTGGGGPGAAAGAPVAAVSPQVNVGTHARARVTRLEVRAARLTRPSPRCPHQAGSERRPTEPTGAGYHAVLPLSRLAQDVPLPGRVCGACGEWLPHACASPDGGRGAKRGAAQAAAWLAQQALTRVQAPHYQAAKARKPAPAPGGEASGRPAERPAAPRPPRPSRAARAGGAAAGAPRRARRSRAVVTDQRPDRRLRWLRPDDGSFDTMKVHHAAWGTPVRLTRAERTAAARQIIRDGGGPSLLSLRLHMSGTTARRLYERLAGRPPGPADTGYRDRVAA